MIMLSIPRLYFLKTISGNKKGLPETKACSRQSGLKKRGAGKNTIPPGIYLFVFIICDRQAEDKFSAHTFGADYIDIFIVSLNDFSGNGQAQAGALFILAS